MERAENASYSLLVPFVSEGSWLDILGVGHNIVGHNIIDPHTSVSPKHCGRCTMC